MAMHNDEQRKRREDQSERVEKEQGGLRADEPYRRNDVVGGPGSGDEVVAEGVGGVSGGAIGAALGSLAGPLGTAIGAIAGAVGGWWTGRAVADAANSVSEEEEDAYRMHYESAPGRLADRGYEDVRPAYHLGRLAHMNPDYSGRSFEEIDAELQRGWTHDLQARYGEWRSIKDFVREGYTGSEHRDRLGGRPRGVSPTEDTLDE
jgi:hypothetical protein